MKRVLWADCLLGGGTAVIGLLWYQALAIFLGLPANLIVIIAAVTMTYALLALSLAFQSAPSILLLRVLIYANWVWTIISIMLLIFYFRDATIFGAAFLILQVLVVGMLAYLEQRYVYFS